MDDFEHYIEINKAWNKRTPIHIKSISMIMKDLKMSKLLKSVELNTIGDVKGKSFLHLQCHFGQIVYLLQE